jgi:dienelactone hydrolase
MQSPASGQVHEIVLFHSVLGLRPAVLEWAERLRACGHAVYTPDLYDGEVFDDLATGMRAVEARGGIGWWMERTHAVASALPAEVVYAGFSNGGGSAELLALTRPGAVGAILMHAALPVEVFGASGWPAAVPLQVHYAEGDPFRDPAAVEALSAAARSAGARVEVCDYACAGHLFADPGFGDHDAEAADLMWERVQRFLSTLPGHEATARARPVRS